MIRLLEISPQTMVLPQSMNSIDLRPLIKIKIQGFSFERKEGNIIKYFILFFKGKQCLIWYRTTLKDTKQEN